MWAGATSFPLAEDAGSTRPQRLPSSRPTCSLVCAPVYIEAWLFCNGVVHRWDLLPEKGDFQQPQQPFCAEANCHAVSVHCHQQFVVNLWVGAVNVLTGPYLLPWRISAQIYHVFLEEKLTEMLEEILLSVRKNIWFQHDGAAAHFASEVWEHPTTTYDCWIGQDKPMVWPPRSPDLTPMAFFIWGHIKTWFTHRQLILRGSYCPYCWGSNNYQATTWHLWMHVSLCCVVVGCESMLVAYVWTSALNW